MQEHENDLHNCLHAVKDQDQDFKEKENFKYSDNPTQLEMEMNELLGECSNDDLHGVHDAFDNMFESAMHRDLTLMAKEHSIPNWDTFCKTFDYVKMFIRMKRVINEMYVTLSSSEERTPES